MPTVPRPSRGHCRLSLRQLFVLVFVAACVALLVRMRYSLYLREATIAACEENREPGLAETGLPPFRLVSSHPFIDSDGRQRHALVFQSMMFVEFDFVVKVVVVDRDYSVVRSRVIALPHRECLTGDARIQHSKTGTDLVLTVSRVFMNVAPPRELPVAVSSDQP